MPQIEAKLESKITSICQFNKDILIGDEKGHQIINFTEQVEKYLTK